MNRQKPVHLKQKIAQTARRASNVAMSATQKAQDGLEEFADDFVAKAAHVADKLENAKESLAEKFRK
ncbi:MAG: hypothetical protein FWF59_11855 [Turicibacter sp.]|nr:hypothetical protein [Turicibacter sp.]